MTVERGGARVAESLYSQVHRQYDADGPTVAPYLDVDVLWFDRGEPVAVAELKNADRERWTLERGKGNGLLAIRHLANRARLPAFVIVVDIRSFAYTVHALNEHGASELQAMERFAISAGYPCRIGHRSGLPAITLHELGYWHFEMLVRARSRGLEQHDADDVERRVRKLRSITLPRGPMVTAHTFMPFHFGPVALKQRPAGIEAASAIEPVTLQVVDGTSLALPNGTPIALPGGLASWLETLLKMDPKQRQRALERISDVPGNVMSLDDARAADDAAAIRQRLRQARLAAERRAQAPLLRVLGWTPMPWWCDLDDGDDDPDDERQRRVS